MGSVFWLQILTAVSSLFVVIMHTVKAIQYARMPIHLRWELYPVAHEKGHGYGGSYLEELDWWTKPRRRSLFGELKYMAREVFLFEKSYRNNRSLWYFTYPFHIGLFLLIIWLLLLLIGAITMLTGMPVAAPANVWGKLIYYLTPAVGVTGLTMGVIGGVGLLIRRSTDKNLKPYTSPLDYFNLAFILTIFLSGLWAWYFFDPTFSTIRGYVSSLLTFTPMTDLNPATSVAIILFSLFLIYLPFTSMTHGLAKYFTYHKVRWDDKPNLRGSDVERKVREVLNQPVSWAAPHIQSGKKWSEIAQGLPEADTGTKAK